MGGGEAGEGLVDAVRPQALAGVLRVDTGLPARGDPVGRAARRCVGRPGVGRGRGVAPGGRPGGHLRGAGVGPGAGHGPARAGGSDGARAGVVRPPATAAARWVCVGRGRLLVGVGFRRASATPAACDVRGRRARRRRVPARSSAAVRRPCGRPRSSSRGRRCRVAPVVGRPSPGAGGVGPSAGCAMAEVLPGRPPPADAVGTGRADRGGAGSSGSGGVGRSRCPAVAHPPGAGRRVARGSVRYRAGLRREAPAGGVPRRVRGPSAP